MRPAPDWATFFSAELAALAALTGFVVVAISINLSRILAFPALPRRSAEAPIGPVGAISVIVIYFRTRDSTKA
jgi:modulator of FtsH protease